MQQRKVRAGASRNKSSQKQKQKQKQNQGILENTALDPDESNLESEDVEFQHTEGLTSQELPKTTDRYLKAYLQRYELQDVGYFCTLRQFDKALKGKRASTIDQWQDYMLTEHEIGIKYGAGRYHLIINSTDKDGVDRIGGIKFTLHDVYDARKMENDMKLLPAQGTSPVLMKGDDGINSAFALIEKIFQMMLPIIAINKQGNNSSGDVSHLMAGQYKVMNDIMKQNMLDNAQLYNDLNRDKMNMPETVETGEELQGLAGLFQGIQPLIENLLPLILGKSAPAAQATVQTVKAMPVFKELTRSKRNIAELIGILDQNYGQEQTSQLLNKFKIKRPKVAAKKS